MHNEIIQIENTLGLKMLAAEHFDTNEFKKILLQCIDNNQAFINTCDFIIVDFSNIKESKLSLDDVFNIALKSNQYRNHTSNAFVFSIATKNNDLYNLFTSWKVMLSYSKAIQMGIFRDIDRAMQWSEIKVKQNSQCHSSGSHLNVS